MSRKVLSAVQPSAAVSGGLEGLGLKVGGKGVQNPLDGTVEKEVQVVEGHADPVVRHTSLGEVVGADPLAPVTASHLVFPRLIGLLVSFLDLPVQQAGTKDLVTLRQKIYVTSNMKYIAEAAEYCRKASEELEAMKLESICDHERIQQLKQNIPGFKQVDFREKEIPLKDFTEIAFREREGSSLLHRPL